MKLEVDLKLLSESKLTPDDYVFLYVIWRKGFNYIDSVSFRIKATRLQDDGWIILNDDRDHTKFVVQQKFKDLFVSDVDKMFEELVRRVQTFRTLVNEKKVPQVEPSTECSTCQYYERCFGKKKRNERDLVQQILGKDFK